jgi:hypothetical protein
MDLIDVLTDATVESGDNDLVVTLGYAALDTYYDELHARFLPRQSGQKLVRTALNFAVQQLATRSRVSRERERFLQLGGFDAADLAASLLGGMPHTMVQWVPGFTSVSAADAAEVVDDVRAMLPEDGMPHQIAITSQDWRELVSTARAGAYGLIAVFSDRNTQVMAECVAALRRLLHQDGRVLVFEALSGGRRPTEFPGPDFVGRYFMAGSGPIRTMSVAVLPAQRAEEADAA